MPPLNHIATLLLLYPLWTYVDGSQLHIKLLPFVSYSREPLLFAMDQIACLHLATHWPIYQHCLCFCTHSEWTGKALKLCIKLLPTAVRQKEPFCYGSDFLPSSCHPWPTEQHCLCHCTRSEQQWLGLALCSKLKNPGEKKVSILPAKARHKITLYFHYYDHLVDQLNDWPARLNVKEITHSFYFANYQ